MTLTEQHHTEPSPLGDVEGVPAPTPAPDQAVAVPVAVATPVPSPAPAPTPTQPAATATSGSRSGGNNNNSNANNPERSVVDPLFSDAHTFRMGSCLCGIPVRLHYTFLLLLAVEVIIAALFSLTQPLYILFVFLMYGPILLGTIVVHELGHALVTKKLGGSVGGIVLWPLGGIALCGAPNGGAKEDLLVAAAGPLTHIPMMLVWLVAYVAITGGDFSDFSARYIDVRLLSSGVTGFLTVLFARSFWLNVFLMALNLLVPAYPLDGGRCMASILIMKGVPVERAARITATTAMIIGAGMMAYGIIAYLFFFTPASIFAILIGVIVLSASKSLLDMEKAGRIREHPLFGRACYGAERNSGVTLRENPEGEVV